MSLALHKLVPDWTVTDDAGQAHKLWDYRQKSHLILLYDPQATAETKDRWRRAIAADRKQWEWLQTSILTVASAPEAMEPGAYLIDRYGRLAASYPADKWSFEAFERDLVYYEARHC